MQILRFIITYIPIIFIIPNFIGLSFVSPSDDTPTNLTEKLISNFIMGFFTMLAIFEILCVPMTILKMHLSTLSLIYSVILFIISLINIYRCKSLITVFWTSILFKARHTINLFTKKKVNFFKKQNSTHVKKPKSILQKLYTTDFSPLYIISSIFLTLLQTYYTIFYDVGFWASDDSTYVAKSMTCVYTNMLAIAGVTSPQMAFDIRRALNTWEIFISYLCQLTGVNAAVMCHTILNTSLLMFIFALFFMISLRLFDSTEDRWLFLLIISLINIFAYHSIYSYAFRMLFTLWQAKGVFMALLIPYTLYKMLTFFDFSNVKKNIVCLMVLSIASTSLTLTGTGMESAIILGLPCLMSIYSRNPRFLLLLIGLVPNILVITIYLGMRTTILV